MQADWIIEETSEQENRNVSKSCQGRSKVSFEGKHERSKKFGDYVQGVEGWAGLGSAIDADRSGSASSALSRDELCT